MADGIRYIAGRSGWETGRFVEGLGSAVGSATPDTWADTAKALGVSVPSAMEFLRSWRPKAAEELDKVEESLAKLEEVSEKETDSVIVTVSFGSPTNRAIREGYWESPKGIPGYNAEIRLKDRSQGWNEGNIEVVGISGTVLSVKHSSGMHGGYYGVSVAVIPETETEIPAFQTARETAAKGSGLPESLFNAFNGDGVHEYPKGSGNWYTGKHTPLITKELFDRVQEQLTRSKITRQDREFAFTKLMFCGLCGSGISACEKYKNQKNGNVHRYVYYGCTKAKDLTCKCGYIKEEEIIEQIINILDTLDVDELGVRQKFKDEIARYNKLRRIVLGKGKEKSDEPDAFDAKAYAKYILTEGTITEKREYYRTSKAD